VKCEKRKGTELACSIDEEEDQPEGKGGKKGEQKSV